MEMNVKLRRKKRDLNEEEIESKCGNYIEMVGINDLFKIKGAIFRCNILTEIRKFFIFGC